MKLSQGKFAARFHLSTATVRDWEQKRRNPDRIAANLLRVIDYSPETVERALQREPHGSVGKPARRSGRTASRT